MINKSNFTSHPFLRPAHICSMFHLGASACPPPKAAGIYHSREKHGTIINLNGSCLIFQNEGRTVSQNHSYHLWRSRPGANRIGLPTSGCDHSRS